MRKSKVFYLIISSLLLYSCDRVYVSETGSDLNTGLTASSPKRNIMDGIAVALANGKKKVFVAEGSYKEEVILSEGVSLFGCYSPDFSVVDCDTHVSNIIMEYDPEPGDRAAVIANSEITRDTAVQGFTIDVKSTSNFSPPTIAGVFCNGGSPTITENIILSNNSYQIYGIRIQSASPLIKNNDIKIGGGFDISYGIFSNEGSPEIIMNRIDAGIFSNGDGSAIYLQSSKNASISLNRIIGSFSNYLAAGIYIDSGGNHLIEKNDVFCGDSNGHGTGIELNNTTGIRIINNIVYGGDGDDISSGIYADSSEAIIRNNTIFIDFYHSYGINIFNQISTSIENNIIYINNISYGFESAVISGVITSLNNNLLYASGNYFPGEDTVYLYSDKAGTDLYNIVDINLLSFASGNISGDPLFIDPLNDDYHLQAISPVNVRQGGLNGSLFGWSYTDDKDGTIRTNIVDDSPDNENAGGWSMGAYEYD